MACFNSGLRKIKKHISEGEKWIKQGDACVKESNDVNRFDKAKECYHRASLYFDDADALNSKNPRALVVKSLEKRRNILANRRQHLRLVEKPDTVSPVDDSANPLVHTRSSVLLGGDDRTRMVGMDERARSSDASQSPAERHIRFSSEASDSEPLSEHAEDTSQSEEPENAAAGRSTEQDGTSCAPRPISTEEVQSSPTTVEAHAPMMNGVDNASAQKQVQQLLDFGVSEETPVQDSAPLVKEVHGLIVRAPINGAAGGQFGGMMPIEQVEASSEEHFESVHPAQAPVQKPDVSSRGYNGLYTESPSDVGVFISPFDACSDDDSETPTEEEPAERRHSASIEPGRRGSVSTKHERRGGASIEPERRGSAATKHGRRDGASIEPECSGSSSNEGQREGASTEREHSRIAFTKRIRGDGASMESEGWDSASIDSKHWGSTNVETQLSTACEKEGSHIYVRDTEDTRVRDKTRDDDEKLAAVIAKCVEFGILSDEELEYLESFENSRSRRVSALRQLLDNKEHKSAANGSENHRGLSSCDMEELASSLMDGGDDIVTLVSHRDSFDHETRTMEQRHSTYSERVHEAGAGDQHVSENWYEAGCSDLRSHCTVTRSTVSTTTSAVGHEGHIARVVPEMSTSVSRSMNTVQLPGVMKREQREERGGSSGSDAGSQRLRSRGTNTVQKVDAATSMRAIVKMDDSPPRGGVSPDMKALPSFEHTNAPEDRPQIQCCRCCCPSSQNPSHLPFCSYGPRADNQLPPPPDCCPLYPQYVFGNPSVAPVAPGPLSVEQESVSQMRIYPTQTDTQEEPFLANMSPRVTQYPSNTPCTRFTAVRDESRTSRPPHPPCTSYDASFHSPYRVSPDTSCNTLCSPRMIGPQGSGTKTGILPSRDPAANLPPSPLPSRDRPIRALPSGCPAAPPTDSDTCDDRLTPSNYQFFPAENSQPLRDFQVPEAVDPTRDHVEDASATPRGDLSPCCHEVLPAPPLPSSPPRPHCAPDILSLPTANAYSSSVHYAHHVAPYEQAYSMAPRSGSPCEPAPRIPHVARVAHTSSQKNLKVILRPPARPHPLPRDDFTMQDRAALRTHATQYQPHCRTALEQRMEPPSVPSLKSPRPPMEYGVSLMTPSAEMLLLSAVAS